MNNYILNNVKEQGIVSIINNMMKDIDETEYINETFKYIQRLFACCHDHYFIDIVCKQCLFMPQMSECNCEMESGVHIIDGNLSENINVLYNLLLSKLDDILHVDIICRDDEKQMINYHVINFIYYMKNKKRVSYIFYSEIDVNNFEKTEDYEKYLRIFYKLRNIA
jgi:hypothetical protein